MNFTLIKIIIIKLVWNLQPKALEKQRGVGLDSSRENFLERITFKPRYERQEDLN